MSQAPRRRRLPSARLTGTAMLMADTPRTVSLRAGLLLRLGIVLVLLLALDAVASYFTALHFANLVYDRWLIDSTRSLAQAVRAEHGLVHFDGPPVALEIFQFDEVDKTYFKVSSESEGFISGDRDLLDVSPEVIGGLRLALQLEHGKAGRPGAAP